MRRFILSVALMLFVSLIAKIALFSDLVALKYSPFNLFAEWHSGQQQEACGYFEWR